MQNQPTTPPTVTPPVNPNQQPRQRFQRDAARIRLHRELVDSETFQKGCDYAMLQYAAALAGQILDEHGVPDESRAKMAGLALLGAHGVMSTLKTLAETPKPLPKIADMSNLNHTRS